MRAIDRDGFGPDVRGGSENLKLYLAMRVKQRTAKFRCRCYRRADRRSSFDGGETNAATAETAATATTDLDAERARETGSSTDLDAERTSNSGRSSTDLEIGKVRQQTIGFKQMLDDGLIDEGEFKALKTKMLGLQDERV